MTEEEIIRHYSDPHDNRLHNTGGPRSRTRVEPVSSSLMEERSLAAVSEIISLQIPQYEKDLEEWLLRFVRALGFSGWEDAEKAIGIPSVKMLVSQQEIPHPPASDRIGILRAGMILCRTSQLRYLPESPRIFTRSRLKRSIRLVVLNTNAYYDLD